jgi:predicted RNA-binding Zn-ribbon protein involved in translation (DUF1610 family)
MTKPKLRTNKRLKVTVIARCCKCGEKIWSNRKWVVLHGAYYCPNEGFAQLVFQEEEWILKNPLVISREYTENLALERRRREQEEGLYTSQH